MIKTVLIFNNHGKPRLVKFFEPLTEEAQQQIIRECFLVISKRPDSACNFLEGIDVLGADTKLIYRHYATLYFVFGVDATESELSILDLIQVFVEALDKRFQNVCELDLIFHVDAVYHILDEIVLGGMVLETSLNEIVTHFESQFRAEKAEQSSAFASMMATTSKAVDAVKNFKK